MQIKRHLSSGLACRITYILRCYNLPRNSHSVEDMKAEFADIINSEETEVFLKYVQDIPAGFNFT